MRAGEDCHSKRSEPAETGSDEMNLNTIVEVKRPKSFDDIEWRGPTATFPDFVARFGDDRLMARATKAAAAS